MTFAADRLGHRLGRQRRRGPGGPDRDHRPDDDATPGGITLTASPDTVAEGAGATLVTVTATVPRRRSGTTRYAEARTVTVSVADGTAASPADYVAADDFDITIAAGAAEGTGRLRIGR